MAAGTAAGGAPLPASERASLEPCFGRGLDDVRVHTGPEAAASARALKAHAYTFGRDVVFGEGKYAPGTTAGQRLLAHELAHVVQQTRQPGAGVQRDKDEAKDATPKDPLCASVTVLPELPEGKLEKPEDRMGAVRALKVIKRCGPADKQKAARDALVAKVGEADAKKFWDQADKAFGGYVGMYPGFADDMKNRLEKLGASETLPFGTFDASGSAADYRRRAGAAAAGEIGDLGRTDILYFRGHQYAQYAAPGVFTNDGTTWVDLRYVQQNGGFANVKLMIATSCATICQEALQVFTGLFPNAVILGYRLSAPVSGLAVRNDFDKKIAGLKRGLLLEQTVDMDAIIGVWKDVVRKETGSNDAPQPGYFRAGTIEYWDGKAWKTDSSPMAAQNKCHLHSDISEYRFLVAPSAAAAAPAPGGE